MKIVNNKLDYSQKWQTPDIYIFTGNRYINRQGGLVMGRGAAQQCRDSWPGCDKALAENIRNNKNANFPNYYLMFCEISPGQILGAFQVKEAYFQKAKLDIVQKSVDYLKKTAEQKDNLKFHMNFPAIGYGGLKYDVVLPIVEKLPDNVILYL